MPIHKFSDAGVNNPFSEQLYSFVFLFSYLIVFVLLPVVQLQLIIFYIPNSAVGSSSGVLATLFSQRVKTMITQTEKISSK